MTKRNDSSLVEFPLNTISINGKEIDFRQLDKYNEEELNQLIHLLLNNLIPSLSKEVITLEEDLINLDIERALILLYMSIGRVSRNRARSLSLIDINKKLLPES